MWDDLMPRRPCGRMLIQTKGRGMYHWMDGWAWFWMTFTMVFWLVVLAAVVYVAVRLAQRPPRERRS